MKIRGGVGASLRLKKCGLNENWNMHRLLFLGMAMMAYMAAHTEKKADSYKKEE